MIFAWNNLFGHVDSLLAANDGGGIINILILVVMLILGLVGHIIKKAQEKRQVEQADDKVEQAKRRRAQQIAAGARQVDSASPQQPQPDSLPPRRLPAAGIAQQPAHVGADLAEGVRGEVSKVRRHLSAEQADRKRRFAHVKGMKSGLRPESAQAEVPVSRQPRIRLDLSSRKAARTAIICAEILGPPKALRTEPEPWEL